MTAASSHVNHRRSEPGRRLRVTALVALAGALAFAAQAALAQATTRLTNVELQPQPGNQIEVKLVLDGPAPQPVAFTIDNPARLAVDLPGTAVALESRRIDVNSSGVDSIVQWSPVGMVGAVVGRRVGPAAGTGEDAAVAGAAGAAHARLERMVRRERIKTREPGARAVRMAVATPGPSILGARSRCRLFTGGPGEGSGRLPCGHPSSSGRWSPPACRAVPRRRSAPRT